MLIRVIAKFVNAIHMHLITQLRMDKYFIISLESTMLFGYIMVYDVDNCLYKSVRVQLYAHIGPYTYGTSRTYAYTHNHMGHPYAYGIIS